MKYFLRIFVALLLCVLLPCSVITLVVSRNSDNLYRENISQAQLRRLEMVSSTNQLIIDAIERDALRIASEPTLSGLGGHTSLSDIVEDRVMMNQLGQISRVLETHVRTNDLLGSVYLYIDGADYVITSDEGVLSLSLLADSIWMDNYDKLQKTNSAAVLLPSHQIRLNYPQEGAAPNKSYGQSFLTYLYPVTPYTSSLWGTLVFNVREDRLQELYAADSSSSAIALFTADGTVLSSTLNAQQQEALDALEWDALLKDPQQGYRVLTLLDGSRWLLTLHHASNGFLYVGLDNMSDLERQQTAFQITLTAILALLAVTGSLMAFIISKRLYSPLQRLYREVGASGRINPGEEHDELSALAKAFQEMLREERRLMGSGGKEKLHEATFQRILSGQEDPDADALLCHKNTICLLAKRDLPLEEPVALEDGEPHTRLLIRMCHEALGSGGFGAEGIQGADSLGILLVSTDEESTEALPALLAILQQVQQEFLTAFHCSVTFSLGAFGPREQIPHSYATARQMLTYRFLRGYGSILIHDRQSEATEYYSATEWLRQIRQCLEQRKKEQLVETVEQFFDELSKKQNISYANVTQILSQLLTDLVQLVDSNRIPLTTLFGGDEDQIYRQIWSKQTLFEVRDWLLKTYDAILDYQSTTSGHVKYIRQAKEYARAHLSEGITVDAIARELGISYSYLRRIYKESTGQNLTDFLVVQRLDTAKQYLRETSLPLREIAERCGYNYERSFSRAFLSAEGITPGRYRELCKEAESNK